MIVHQTRQCKICFGFGLHAFGPQTAMHPIAADSGEVSIECPECHSNINPFHLRKQRASTWRRH